MPEADRQAVGSRRDLARLAGRSTRLHHALVRGLRHGGRSRPRSRGTRPEPQRIGNCLRTGNAFADPDMPCSNLSVKRATLHMRCHPLPRNETAESTAPMRSRNRPGNRLSSPVSPLGSKRGVSRETRRLAPWWAQFASTGNRLLPPPDVSRETRGPPAPLFPAGPVHPGALGSAARTAPICLYRTG